MQEYIIIKQARTTFQKMKKFLCNRNLKLNVRYRVLKCYVYYVFAIWNGIIDIKSELCEENWNFWDVGFSKDAQNLMDRSYHQQQHFGNDGNEPTNCGNDKKTWKTPYLEHNFINKKYKLLQLNMLGKLAGERGPVGCQIS